jgi:hypothetical protein
LETTFFLLGASKRLLKNHLIRLLKKVPDAWLAKKAPAKAYMEVRCSERFECNAADGPFSAAC